MLTVLLALMTDAATPPGPLLIGYPLIIVGGALFFDARRVMLVTVAAIVSYLALLWAEPSSDSPQSITTFAS